MRTEITYYNKSLLFYKTSKNHPKIRKYRNEIKIIPPDKGIGQAMNKEYRGWRSTCQHIYQYGGISNGFLKERSESRKRI